MGSSTSIIAIFSVLFTLTSPVLAKSPAPSETLTLQAPEGVKTTQPPVAFKHLKHEQLECTACHHTWDGESEVQQCSSQGCHDVFEDKRADNSFYKAFHNRQSEVSCMGCHWAKRQKDEKHGPTSCLECHPRD